MMRTKSNEKSAAISRIAAINQVDGFDPASLAAEYTDPDNGEKRMRLPVMAQMAWFRLVYPEGKISVTAALDKDCYVGHARVYHSYMDQTECFLAEAIASRKYDPDKPDVSSRESAQTAAIGSALLNAGFGLQFYAAGDPVDPLPADELIGLTDAMASAGQSEPVSQTETVLDDKPAADAAAEPAAQTETNGAEEVSPDDAFQQALNMPCPIQKYAGKTQGDLLTAGETGALIWVANKFNKDPKIAAGARLICEKSMEYSA